MMENKVEFTPRFNKGEISNKKLLMIEDIPNKKIQTCKNLSKFKRKSNKSSKSVISKKSGKSKKSKKSKKTHKSNSKLKNFKTSKSTKTVNNNLNYINVKNKFFLRNDFDSKHCKQFLKEKYLMLEKPILFDEICN